MTRCKRAPWLLLPLFLAVACEDDHGHDLGPDCQAIVDACHHLDDGSDGAIGDCHDLGHDGDEAACTAELADCVDTVCVES